MPPTRALSRSRAAPGRQVVTRAERVVIKIGSGVIAARGKVRQRVVSDLVHDVTVLVHRGFEVVMVVSGAVASGYQPLGMPAPPKAVLDRQVAASVGQPRLMAVMGKAFARNRLLVAQLLMSSYDIENRRRFLSARHTLEGLLERRVIPIINENDALSDPEATVGDNDHLAALVTNVVSADLLIILSSVPGVLEGENGPVIPLVEIGKSIDQHISREMTSTGVGGMVAKVSAAHLASRWGVPTVVAGGGQPGMLQAVLSGQNVGTLFLPDEPKLSSRKRWIAVRKTSRGTLRVDAGARRALLEKSASLLSTGIRGVEGDFSRGTRVDVCDEHGEVFAVGLVSYDSDEIERIKGRKSADIPQILGYEYVDEVIHRDDLVLLSLKSADPARTP